jgi:hypothetical protein
MLITHFKRSYLLLYEKYVLMKKEEEKKTTAKFRRGVYLYSFFQLPYKAVASSSSLSS